MLPRINRIKKKKDFEKIFKNSVSLKNNLFILRIAKNDLGLNRFGFVVSQKVSKKATVRNKIRRRLSEAIRDEVKNIENGTDLVFVVMRGMDKKDFSETKKTINEALIMAKLIARQ
jgi:ribonuclease P protein component